jgi:hypothetical protein
MVAAAGSSLQKSYLESRAEQRAQYDNDAMSWALEFAEPAVAAKALPALLWAIILPFTQIWHWPQLMCRQTAGWCCYLCPPGTHTHGRTTETTVLKRRHGRQDDLSMPLLWQMPNRLTDQQVKKVPRYTSTKKQRHAMHTSYICELVGVVLFAEVTPG